MMRPIKTIPLLLLLLLFPALPGCRSDTIYREPERQYLVSAIGFDGAGGEQLRASLEVIIFSVGKAESSIESKTFSGVGRTVKSALGSLSGEIAKKLLYDHCALIVLGESLDAGQVEEALRFCGSGKDIPVSSSLVSSPDAAALLSCVSISTPVAGYDITGVIKQKSEDWGIGLSNRLYEVEGRRLGGKNHFALPHFSVSGGAEPVYSFSGIRIYENDLPSLLFDLPEGALYSLLIGTYGSGTFYFEYGGEIYQPEVRRASSSVETGEGCGRLCLTVKMRLVLRRGQREKIDTAELSAALEEKAKEFFDAARASSRSDIFEIAGRTGYVPEPGEVAENEYPEVDISFDITAPEE